MLINITQDQKRRSPRKIYYSEKHLTFGIHAVSAIKNQPERIDQLCVKKIRKDQKCKGSLSSDQHRIKIAYHSRISLDQLTKTEQHQGIVAFCHKPKNYSEHDLTDILEKLTTPPFLLILDGIQDPHNLGACLRSADAAGVHAVIVPKDKSAKITAAVSKVASGAAEIIPFVQVTNLARFMRFLKEQNIWVFGASSNAKKTLYDANLKVPLAMVMGSEGSGLRRLTEEHWIYC